MAKIDVTGENFLKIMEIQRVILKDVINAGLDEALARVLDFYRRFVPNK